MLLPLSLMISCDDKEDLAPFDLTVTLSGVSQVDNTFYAVKGTSVTIDNLSVKAVGGKDTSLANVNFFVDGIPLFDGPWNLAGPITFSTAALPTGTHSINVSGNLLQVDQPVSVFTANYTLVVVDNEEGLPEGAPELGTFSQTINFTN